MEIVENRFLTLKIKLIFYVYKIQFTPSTCQLLIIIFCKATNAISRIYVLLHLAF